VLVRERVPSSLSDACNHCVDGSTELDERHPVHETRSIPARHARHENLLAGAELAHDSFGSEARDHDLEAIRRLGGVVVRRVEDLHAGEVVGLVFERTQDESVEACFANRVTYLRGAALVEIS